MSTIRNLCALGKTVFLTTHYMDEAQALADRIAVVRAGELVVLRTEEPTRVLHDLTAQALAEGRELEGLEVRRPTLEEIYLALMDTEGE